MKVSSLEPGLTIRLEKQLAMEVTGSLKSKTVACKSQLWTEHLLDHPTLSLPGSVLVVSVKHTKEVSWRLTSSTE